MRVVLTLVLAIFLPPLVSRAQTQPGVPVTLRVIPEADSNKTVRPVVGWLEPLEGHLPFPPRARYTLLQKNRTFIPHVQVVPIGSDVEFPNADPFFHNVFSLYQGKRFDLGLYEAGSSKLVKFVRPGVSYIFCNIHPEMSAVILALTSPLYVISSMGAKSSIGPVPPGDYTLHIWAEGIPQPSLDNLTRHIHVGEAAVDLGAVAIALPASVPAPHLNKFGKPYEAPDNRRY